ncbi:hypothetical protein AVEN_121100-1 [Araneus ventricosus]|uniref:Uncharacterized protein n=1 Tax=Araneus ventricosus TaxID=182803 RepID=A0A4Y2PAG8_ARAVE|nr:hypothetical protein AVEN_121100-1 [Araneus ventricosus]
MGNDDSTLYVKLFPLGLAHIIRTFDIGREKLLSGSVLHIWPLKLCIVAPKKPTDCREELCGARIVPTYPSRLVTDGNISMRDLKELNNIQRN